MQYCAFGKHDQRCLDGFYLRLVKHILHLPHKFHVSYADSKRLTGVACPLLRLAKEPLRWTGHELRSAEKVLSEVLTFIPEGGRPRLRFFDPIKADLKSRDIEVNARRQPDFSQQGLLIVRSGVQKL